MAVLKYLIKKNLKYFFNSRKKISLFILIPFILFLCFGSILYSSNKNILSIGIVENDLYSPISNYLLEVVNNDVKTFIFSNFEECSDFLESKIILACVTFSHNEILVQINPAETEKTKLIEDKLKKVLQEYSQKLRDKELENKLQNINDNKTNLTIKNISSFEKNYSNETNISIKIDKTINRNITKNTDSNLSSENKTVNKNIQKIKEDFSNLNTTKIKKQVKGKYNIFLKKVELFFYNLKDNFFYFVKSIKLQKEDTFKNISSLSEEKSYIETEDNFNSTKIKFNEYTKLKPVSKLKQTLLQVFTYIIFILTFFISSTILYKEKKSSNNVRLILSKIKTGIFLLSYLLSSLILVFIQLIIFFFILYLSFPKDILGILPSLIGYSIVGILLFSLIGILVGSISKNSLDHFLYIVIVSVLFFLFNGKLISLEIFPKNIIILITLLNPINLYETGLKNLLVLLYFKKSIILKFVFQYFILFILNILVISYSKKRTSFYLIQEVGFDKKFSVLKNGFVNIIYSINPTLRLFLLPLIYSIFYTIFILIIKGILYFNPLTFRTVFLLGLTYHVIYRIFCYYRID